MSQIEPCREKICSRQEISDGQTDGRVDKLITIGCPQNRALKIIEVYGKIHISTTDCP